VLLLNECVLLLLFILLWTQSEKLLDTASYMYTFSFFIFPILLFFIRVVYILCKVKMTTLYKGYR